MIILASAWPSNMALWCVANSQQYIQICAAIWMVGTSECKHGRGSYLLNLYSEEPSPESLMCLLWFPAEQSCKQVQARRKTATTPPLEILIRQHSADAAGPPARWEIPWRLQFFISKNIHRILKTLPKALRTQALTALTSNFGLVCLAQYAW